MAQQNDFGFEEWGKFWTIGFLAEEYFAAYVEGTAETAYLYDDSNDTNPMVDEQLSKILIDGDDEVTFTTGTPLKLEVDYELAIRAIDLEEYDIVNGDLLGPLSKACDAGPDRLFMAPGSHGVDQVVFEKLPSEIKKPPGSEDGIHRKM